MDATAIAQRALPLLDLTDLADDATENGARHLCDRAETPFGPVAAVCLWPRFVSLAKDVLRDSEARVATVVNFPAGGDDTGAVIAETEQAVADGADEIDLVIPWRALLEGRPGFAETQISRVRRVLPRGVLLKTILETGSLGSAANIALAADVALAAGSDFLKTSTGKVGIGATPEAAEILLTKISGAGRPVGFKASGGIRSLADAATYLTLADRLLGEHWVSPDTFRFGASGLLDVLLATLSGAAAPAAAKGY
ncbi:deoxyribose-phosphate aldolase [Segnochrobactraceae bacterium EtOH-i3]